MKSLEIFSGAGGLALGLHKAGFNHVGLLEYNKDACNTLRANFPTNKVFENDIRDFKFEQFNELDILSGGPPCQPFSLGGKAKGQNDKRDMFPYAINGIRELRPKAFIFENVKGLLRQSFATYFNYIILQLSFPEIIINKNEDWNSHLSRLEKAHTKGHSDGLKYNVIFRLLNSANYGIPQKRERVFIVGIRSDLDKDWSFPEPTHSIDRLLWDKFVTKSYWDKHKISKSQIENPSTILEKRIEKLKFNYGFFEPSEQPWKTVRETISDLPDPRSLTNRFEDHIFRNGAKIYPGHTGSYIDDPAKTIKAGNHGVPGGENMVRLPDGKVRYFTIREAKRLQTVDDHYKITGSWSEGMRQIGNAVPVKLGEIIGTSLHKKLCC